MEKTTTSHKNLTDKRLIAFVADFAASGNTLMHFTAQYSIELGHQLDFLDDCHQQYLHASMQEMFSEPQRIEFEFLAKKYKLRRTEVYTKGIQLA